MERHSFPLSILAVPGEPAGVRLPATFEAQYDSTEQAYRFTLWMAAVRT